MAAHNELSKWGEDIATTYLAEHGHQIIARDWHCGKRDLDIITIYDNTLTITEVKTRSNNFFIEPEDAVDRRKIHSISIATNAFVKKHKIDLDISFDIISIVGTKDDYQLRHIQNAFLPL